ncbi:MAG: non-ribosomal peptide synthetase, partial [Marivirga sp.]|nr:non-ribosomal peptide synthetase [Marivirga sp.]
MIFGGEMLMPSKLSKWYAKYPGVKLINMFGITETTVHVTYKEIGEEEITQNVSNIGRPLPTVSVYVLDNNKQLVPQGVIGEMYVGGLGLGRGYLNNESLTAERFIRSPYRAGERLYRTGDLARILSNGEIEYKGRCDHQVQLRGFRIEPGEIEYHLIQNTQIDEAVVISAVDEEERSYLCAYVVGKEKLSVDDVRSYLSRKVPSYMVPSYIVQIEKIPFTANNKLDREKLPKPGVEVSAGYLAPGSPEEMTMSDIWSRLLSVEKVGVRDNYFSLGGDSLRAIGLISETNNALHTSLTIADLYSHQTIEELIALLKEVQDRHDNELQQAQEDLKAFQREYREKYNFPENYEEVYPMNGVEKGMVFHSLKGRRNGSDIHNIMYHEQTVYPVYV